MNNPATIKRRKKLRHRRHKREADRFHQYLNSPKFEEDLKIGMRKMRQDLAERLKNIETNEQNKEGLEKS